MKRGNKRSFNGAYDEKSYWKAKKETNLKIIREQSSSQIKIY